MLTDPLSSPAPAVLATPTLDDPALYLNRELSWLEFNWRVLDEALQPLQPLLERVKFFAIFATNLDEFFMIRVAGLRRQVRAGVAQAPPDLGSRSVPTAPYTPHNAPGRGRSFSRTSFPN